MRRECVCVPSPVARDACVEIRLRSNNESGAYPSVTISRTREQPASVDRDEPVPVAAPVVEPDPGQHREVAVVRTSATATVDEVQRRHAVVQVAEGRPGVVGIASERLGEPADDRGPAHVRLAALDRERAVGGEAGGQARRRRPGRPTCCSGRWCRARLPGSAARRGPSAQRTRAVGVKVTGIDSGPVMKFDVPERERVASGQLQVGQAAEHLAEHDPQLEPGERRPEAEVRPEAEREVRVRVTASRRAGRRRRTRPRRGWPTGRRG